MSTYEFVCIYMTQTLEKKNQVFTPVNYSPDRINTKKKEKEEEEKMICVLNIGKKRTLKTIECVD
jgi:hypothetical protein